MWFGFVFEAFGAGEDEDCGDGDWSLDWGFVVVGEGGGLGEGFAPGG